jgi:hypothetical protein
MWKYLGEGQLYPDYEPDKKDKKVVRAVEEEKVEREEREEVERPSGAYNFRATGEGIITFDFDWEEISAVITFSGHAQLEEEEGQSFTSHGSKEEISKLYAARGY